MAADDEITHRDLLTRIDSIDDKLDTVARDSSDRMIEMIENTSQLKEILAGQHKSLEYHIKRTDLLQELVNQNKEDLDKRLSEVSTDMKPVVSHVNGMNWVFKAVAALGVLSGVIASVLKLIGYKF